MNIIFVFMWVWGKGQSRLFWQALRNLPPFDLFWILFLDASADLLFYGALMISQDLSRFRRPGEVGHPDRGVLRVGEACQECGPEPIEPVLGRIEGCHGPDFHISWHYTVSWAPNQGQCARQLPGCPCGWAGLLVLSKVVSPGHLY